MKKIVYIIFIVLIGCTSTKDVAKEMSSDSLLKEYFTDKELFEMSKILSYFENELKGDVQEKSLEKTYKNFYIKALKYRDSGITHLGMDIRNKDLPIFKISKSTFDKIWSYNFELKEKDTLKKIYINPERAYLKFLEALGKEYSPISEYVESMKITYDISPFYAHVFVNNYKNFNFEDPKIRLFLAIHYMTLLENN